MLRRLYAAFDGRFLPAQVARLNSLVQTRQYGLSNALHAGVVMVLRLGDERHVTRVQEKGIGQRQGFIVKAVDVAGEAATCLPDSRTQSQPTRQPQNCIAREIVEVDATLVFVAMVS